MKTVSIDLANHATWPLRMKRVEVAKVMRWSQRTLRERIQHGRFPPPDDGITWARDVVVRYAVQGGVKEFEREYQRRERRQPSNRLSVVGGSRG
jgi:hypothetical protein